MSDNYLTEPLKVAIRHEKLPSGVRVVTGEMSHTSAVSVVLIFKVGSRYETDEQAGMSHLFEHMLFKGTRKRPSHKETVHPIESVGGLLNAFTGREETGYWCKVARAHFTAGIDVLADMVSHPLLIPEEIEKEKQVVFEEIHSNKDSPSAAAELHLDSMLWPLHPLGRDIAGTVESVSNIEQSSMLECLESQYVASNLVVSVAGAVKHDEVVELVQNLLGDFRIGQGDHQTPAVEDNLTGPYVKFEERKLEQAHLAMGMRGISFHSPKRYAISLLSVILGETMTSRLFTEIRENKGFAYDISSGSTSLSDTGAFYIHSGLDPKRLKEGLDCISAELRCLKREGVTDGELKDAKEYVCGRLLLRMEESRAVAGFLAAREVQDRPIENMNEIADAFRSVTLEDVSEVAAEVFARNTAAMAIVGPGKEPYGLADTLDF